MILHGGKNMYEVNYLETYAATIVWQIIRLMLPQAIIMVWQTKPIDFTIVYFHAEAECELYIDIHKGFAIPGGNNNHCLKILKNMYGLWQAGSIL